MVLFVSEVLPVDLVALSILAALLLTGLLTPEEGLSGFSHIATVTIGAMFVLSEGVRRTGALNAVGDQTNTLEYGSGAPLNVIFWVLGTFLIPVIWPL